MANTTGKKFGGRQKGTPNKRGRYITIASICESIEETLGMSYQDALSDLLASARDDYLHGTDKDTYPKIMLKLADKLIEQARQMPDDTDSNIADMTDEELRDKQKQLVLDYIKVNGVPVETT